MRLNQTGVIYPSHWGHMEIPESVRALLLELPLHLDEEEPS